MATKSKFRFVSKALLEGENSTDGESSCLDTDDEVESKKAKKEVAGKGKKVEEEAPADKGKEEKKRVKIPKATERTKNHSIAKDLLPLDVPLDIKREADRICQSLNQKTHRNRKRKYLIFICLYWAYKKVGEEKDPTILSKLVGFEPNKIQAAFSLFSSAKTGYCPPKKYTSADERLPEFCKALGLELEGVLELSKELLAKDPSLDEKPPQTLAAGIIKYYVKINGIQISDSKIVSACGRTITCISTMMSKVSEVHNS